MVQEVHMIDLLALAYPWIKAIHIMAVITWMAGIFYLPRLFVYHAEQSQPGDSRDQIFTVMEYKLYRYIMNPSIIAVWIFGLLLVMTPGIVDWSAIWPWAKAAAVIAMTWFHMWLGKRRKEFAGGINTRTGRSYRIMNEVPTILMFVIVIAVVVKF
jgi:protoporphyrinogen IX oxidase